MTCPPPRKKFCWAAPMEKFLNTYLHIRKSTIARIQIRIMITAIPTKTVAARKAGDRIDEKSSRRPRQISRPSWLKIDVISNVQLSELLLRTKSRKSRRPGHQELIEIKRQISNSFFIISNYRKHFELLKILFENWLLRL